MAEYPRQPNGFTHGDGARSRLTAQSTPIAATRHTYHALDGLRGVAALLVVIYHAEFIAGVNLAPNGYLAVDLFFAISGFVIAHAYDARLSDGLSVGRFALMRILRFWPLYMLGLLLGLAVQLHYATIGHPTAMTPWKIWAAFAFNAVFLPAPFQTYGNVLFPLNPVAWSLFFELVVNILYACFLPLLSRRATGSVMLISGAIFAVGAIAHGGTNVGWSSTEIWLGLVRTIFSFSVGVFIFRTEYRGPTLPFAALIALTVLFLAMPIGKGASLFVALGFTLFLSPMIVAMATQAHAPARALRLSAWLGAISYALYAVHRPLLSIANLAKEQMDAPGLIMAGLAMVALCALCGWLDKRFDGPARRYLGNRLGLSRARLKPA